MSSDKIDLERAREAVERLREDLDVASDIFRFRDPCDLVQRLELGHRLARERIAQLEAGPRRWLVMSGPRISYGTFSTLKEAEEICHRIAQDGIVTTIAPLYAGEPEEVGE